MLFCVNSIEYKSRGTLKPVEGIKEILDFLTSELSEEDLKKLFLATYNNITYWNKFLSTTNKKVNIITTFISENKQMFLDMLTITKDALIIVKQIVRTFH